MFPPVALVVSASPLAQGNQGSTTFGVCSLPPWHPLEGLRGFAAFNSVWFFSLSERLEKRGRVELLVPTHPVTNLPSYVTREPVKGNTVRGSSARWDGADGLVERSWRSFLCRWGTPPLRFQHWGTSCGNREGLGCRCALYPRNTRWGCKV